jgi:FkbM family methyltransferase
MLRDLLRAILPVSLRRAVRDALGLPRVMHENFAGLRLISGVSGKHVMMDVGAFEGWFTDCWLHCYPDATVVAFEPSEDALRSKLRPRFGAHPNVELVKAACGAREEIRNLRLLDSPASNSLLELRGDSGLKIAQIGEQMVKVIRLGDFIRERRIEEIEMVKIDAQGMEMDVLEGLDGELERVHHLYVEASVHPVYQTSATFARVFEFLAQRGFRMLDMRATTLGTGYVRECDMLFGRADRLLGLSKASQ